MHEDVENILGIKPRGEEQSLTHPPDSTASGKTMRRWGFTLLCLALIVGAWARMTYFTLEPLFDHYEGSRDVRSQFMVARGLKSVDDLYSAMMRDGHLLKQVTRAVEQDRDTWIFLTYNLSRDWSTSIRLFTFRSDEGAVKAIATSGRTAVFLPAIIAVVVFSVSGLVLVVRGLVRERRELVA